MRIGNIEIVAWIFCNIGSNGSIKCKLISSTQKDNNEYDNEEFYLTYDDYELWCKKYPLKGVDEVIEQYYLTLCKKKRLLLVDYHTLKKLESQMEALG